MARSYGSTAARGYGRLHQKLRKEWKPLVDSGQVQCHAIVCLEERDGRGRWIAPGAPWHLGHTPDRSGWTGPEHQRCGASDGATRGNRQYPRRIAAALPGRSPVCGECGKEYHYSSKQCTICGRHYHPSYGEQRTCSRACGVELRRRNHGTAGSTPQPRPRCKVCGRLCQNLDGLYCSKACMGEGFRQNWPSSALQHYTCRYCGKPGITKATTQPREVCPERECQLARLAANNQRLRYGVSKEDADAQMANAIATAGSWRDYSRSARRW